VVPIGRLFSNAVSHGRCWGGVAAVDRWPHGSLKGLALKATKYDDVRREWSL